MIQPAETKVRCGACLNPDISRDDAQFIEYMPMHFAFICRECMSSYMDVVRFIRPYEIKTKAA